MFVQPGLTLTPLRIVAPVGTEVLMVAGVHGAGDPLLTGQRVEWMMAPGSVGTFLAVGEREGPNFLRWFGTPPQKISNDYAVTETVSVSRIITRGTIDPADDVSVLPGQAWVTLSSPIEGSSHVTAFAPELVGTTGNRQSGVIHWVDARWKCAAIGHRADGDEPCDDSDCGATFHGDAGGGIQGGAMRWFRARRLVLVRRQAVEWS